MFRRCPRLLASRPLIFFQKDSLCLGKLPFTSPKVSTRFACAEDDEDNIHSLVKRHSAILNKPLFKSDSLSSDIVMPIQLAESLLVDLTIISDVKTIRHSPMTMAKVLPWVPCVLYNKITADKSAKCLADFISDGGWSNWLKALDTLFELKIAHPYYLLMALKWIGKLNKLLITEKFNDQVGDVIHLSDGSRLITWLIYLFSHSEIFNISNLSSLSRIAHNLVGILDKRNTTTTNQNDDNPLHSLIDDQLKPEIRKRLIRIYNTFKMDRQYRGRAFNEMQTFSSVFYQLLYKIRVFDREFYTVAAEKVDAKVLAEHNLSDIYELESYTALMEMIGTKLVDDFIHASGYASVVRDKNSQFIELAHLMQYAELINLFNVLENRTQVQWVNLFLYRLKVFAPLYLYRANPTSASILRLFLLISLKNDRGKAFDTFKKEHFEAKFRENLPFFTDEQLNEMKTVVKDKLNVDLDYLYK